MKFEEFESGKFFIPYSIFAYGIQNIRRKLKNCCEDRKQNQNGSSNIYYIKFMMVKLWLAHCRLFHWSKSVKLFSCSVYTKFFHNFFPFFFFLLLLSISLHDYVFIIIFVYIDILDGWEKERKRWMIIGKQKVYHMRTTRSVVHSEKKIEWLTEQRRSQKGYWTWRKTFSFHFMNHFDISAKNQGLYWTLRPLPSSYYYFCTDKHA